MHLLRTSTAESWTSLLNAARQLLIGLLCDYVRGANAVFVQRFPAVHIFRRAELQPAAMARIVRCGDWRTVRSMGFVGAQADSGSASLAARERRQRACGNAYLLGRVPDCDIPLLQDVHQKFIGVQWLVLGGDQFFLSRLYFLRAGDFLSVHIALCSALPNARAIVSRSNIRHMLMSWCYFAAFCSHFDLMAGHIRRGPRSSVHVEHKGQYDPQADVVEILWIEPPFVQHFQTFHPHHFLSAGLRPQVDLPVMPRGALRQTVMSEIARFLLEGTPTCSISVKQGCQITQASKSACHLHNIAVVVRFSLFDRYYYFC